VLNLPVELAVRIPGSSEPVGLGSLYQRGGVALTADVVRELVGLEPPRPDRYLVLPRSALRRIVDRVGGLELSPPQVMRYQDKAQKYKIDLQSGLQRLSGSQVEQLVRFRDPGLGDSGRRIDHQLVETGLRERFRQPEQVSQLPDLLRDLQGQVETNLSARESLSLLSAGLDDQRPIQFTRLLLKPANKDFGGLRQLDVPPGKGLWKAP
jgi:LCP family protein required for cell wall assembly